MCGIVGYIGAQNGRATTILQDLLSRVTYRGYDSWGMVAYSEIKARHGKSTSDLRLSSIEPFGDWGIGHTRWATHGGVTEANAHPHVDCDGRISVVHNGIIENYQELKRKLISSGHKFRSETDTEVIPHLIEEHLKDSGNPHYAFNEAVRELDGTYSILATLYMARMIFAAKKDSPLIIGRKGSMEGCTETYVASDVLSLLPYCDMFVKLQDGDTATITELGVRTFRNGRMLKRPAVREVTDVKWADLSADSMSAYAYMTLDEINHQISSLEYALQQDPGKLERVIRDLRRAKLVILTGSGSSYNAAVLGGYLLSSLGIPAIAVTSPELSQYENVADKDVVVIPLSQSGETMDLILPLKGLRRKKARIHSILNFPLSTVEDLSATVLPINCGPEYATVATKSFTGQQMVLYQLFYGLKGRKDYGKSILKETVEAIPQVLEMRFSDEMEDIIVRELLTESFAILGAGPSYSTAREMALKLNEWTEIPTHSYQSGEFKHGPLQLVQPYRKMSSILFAPTDEHLVKTLNVTKEIGGRGGHTIGIATEEHKGLFDRTLIAPRVEVVQPLLAIMGQLFSYNLAEQMRDLIYKKKGIYPFERTKTPMDRPDNIAKSITVS